MQIVEELHAARVGKSLDLPVVPPPGELANMEVDSVEDVQSFAGTIYVYDNVDASWAFLRVNLPRFNFYIRWKILKCADKVWYISFSCRN